MTQSPEIPTIPAVVLAGGKAKPEIVAATGQTNRALVVVQGKTLLRHVTDALTAAAPTVGRIVVVGDTPESADYALLADTDDFVGNVMAGAGAFPDATYLLYVTSDLPFLSGEIVAKFVREAAAKAKAENAALIWPVVPAALCYARFPGVKRTTLRLREGEFTGGNLMLVRADFLAGQKARIAEVYAARKSNAKLAGIIGIGTLLHLAISQLVSPKLMTIRALEGRISRLVGAPARALICDAPEIATDMDRPSDFAAVGLTQEGAPS